MAAAGIGPAIDALEAVMQEAVQNSKIANTLDREISKSLGLLVDLILLPFLPIITGAIIQLYLAVLKFGEWWNNVTGVLKKEGLLGLLKISLEAIGEGVVGWILNMLKAIFGGDKQETKATLETTMKFLTGLISGIIPVDMVLALLDFVFGEGTVKNIETSIIAALGAISRLEEYLLNFVFGLGSLAKSTISASIEIGVKAIGQFADYVMKLLGYILGVGVTEAKKAIDATINLTKGNPLDSAWSAFEAIQSGVGGFVGGVTKLLGFADGGVVPGPKGAPQLVVAHGGETITPPGSSIASGGHTFNFYGLTNDDLPEKVRGILRQEGTRYMS